MVGELLGDLMNRGLDFSQPRLYVLDGGKALSAAVKSMPAYSTQRFLFPRGANLLWGAF